MSRGVSGRARLTARERASVDEIQSLDYVARAVTVASTGSGKWCRSRPLFIAMSAHVYVADRRPSASPRHYRTQSRREISLPAAAAPRRDAVRCRVQDGAPFPTRATQALHVVIQNRVIAPEWRRAARAPKKSPPCVRLARSGPRCLQGAFPGPDASDWGNFRAGGHGSHELGL